MKYQYNDGGRSVSGFKGHANDCVCRAIAIAAQLPYNEVYAKLAEGQKSIGKSKSARNGIFTKKKWFKEYMHSLGFEWRPFMKIGKGCTVHLRSNELPEGRLICAVSRHYVAVIDRVINDTFDPSRNGNRCVYGMWVHKQKYIATEDTDILYTYQHGGGILGRKVKKGEVVTYIGTHTNIDTPFITFIETLKGIPENTFKSSFKKI